jgi:hypothetical protein
MRSQRPLAFALLGTLGIAAFVCACTNEASTEPGDPPADAGAPSALGNGLRIAEMNNPDSAVRPANNQANVYVTGASLIIKDTFNENNKASSVGAVYVQDFHSNLTDGGAAPFSGIQLYKATYEPASLAIAPGDVIDFTGEYQEYDGPSSFSFGGAYQPEMYEPIVTFRFDYSPPAPTLIDVHDLESYAKGYQWMSMLVTVKNAIGGNTTYDGSGAGGVFLTTDNGPNAVTMDNELFPLDFNDPKYGTTPGSVTFKSVTGVVTYFDSFHIAPRSEADIQIEPTE